MPAPLTCPGCFSTDTCLFPGAQLTSGTVSWAAFFRASLVIASSETAAIWFSVRFQAVVIYLSVSLTVLRLFSCFWTDHVCELYSVLQPWRCIAICSRVPVVLWCVCKADSNYFYVPIHLVGHKQDCITAVKCTVVGILGLYQRQDVFVSVFQIPKEILAVIFFYFLYLC